MLSSASSAAENGDARRAVEEVREPLQLFLVRLSLRGCGKEPARDATSKRLQRDVAGDDDDGDAPSTDGDTHGAQQDLRQLLRVADKLNVVAAFLEEAFRMGRLEVVDADLAARNMRSDRKNGHVAAVRVEQSVDQVEVAWAAAAGADRELAREVCLGAGGEGGAFFMAHVNPLDGFQSPERVGEPVQRIADDA